MHHYYLYGQPIESEISFFDDFNELPSPEIAKKSLKLKRGELEHDHRNLKVVGTPSCTHGRTVTLLSESIKPTADYEGAWKLEVESVVTFGGFGGGDQIFFEPSANTDDELVGFWFVHLVLPMYLSYMKGWHFLHAATVEIDDKAIVMLAPSMGGKSTLANYFVSRGHGLMSDDKIAVRMESGELLAIASHNWCRPYREFEDLGVTAKASSKSEMPVGVIFLLNAVNSAAHVKFIKLGRRESYEALVDATLFDSDGQKTHILGCLGAWSKQVPIYKLDVPRDLARLPLVFKEIIQFLSLGCLSMPAVVSNN